MLKRIWFALGISVWLVYLFHFDPISAGSDRFVYLVMSLVEHHRFSIDLYRHLTPELSFYGGHYFVNTNPGLSFLAAPAWFIVWPFYRMLSGVWISGDHVHYVIAHFVTFAFTTALCAAFAAVLIAQWIYERTGRAQRAAFASLLYSFGSIAFPVSSKLNQNGVVSLLCLAVFCLIFPAKDALRISEDSKRGLCIGFLSGLALLVDYSALPFLAAAGLFILLQPNALKTAAWAIAGSMGPLLALAVYQGAFFANPFLPAQAYLWNIEQTNFSKTLLGFTWPNWREAAQYLIYPKAGVFYYMPYTLAALWYLPSRKKMNQVGLFPEERFFIGLTFILYLIFVSVQPSPFTAFGPRYMLPLFPLICMACAIYVNPFQNLIITGLIFWGFLGAVAGAELGVDTGNIFITAGAWLLRGPWLPILDWIKTDALKGMAYYPDVLTSYGLFFVLFACLACVWLPVFLKNSHKGELKS